MVINEGPVRNLINKAKKSYNAVMGNTSGNYDMSVHSHDEAKELLSGTVLKGYEDEFDEDSYQMSYDPDRSYLKFEFSAKRVPNSLVNDLKPGSGKLYKYVTNYDKDHAVLTMELPVDRQVMKVVYNDNAPKSNAKPEPKDTMNPKDGTTQEDQESAEMTGESMMAPTNLTITGKRTLQCDDEGHEILRDKVLGEGMVIREAYYKEVRSKTVYDSDGFTTEYTLYHNTDDDTYLCIFGDRELYTPENSDPDWEGETEDEALEWFNDYEGPGAYDLDWEYDDSDFDNDEEENWTLDDIEDDQEDDDSDVDDEVVEEESIKLRTESADRALSATDVVMNLYDKFPEIDFYDERDLSDNLVGLIFDAKKIYKDMDKKKSLEDYLVQHNIDYRFNAGRLLIKAREDDEYQHEGDEDNEDLKVEESVTLDEYLVTGWDEPDYGPEPEYEYFDDTAVVNFVIIDEGAPRELISNLESLNIYDPKGNPVKTIPADELATDIFEHIPFTDEAVDCTKLKIEGTVEITYSVTLEGHREIGGEYNDGIAEYSDWFESDGVYIEDSETQYKFTDLKFTDLSNENLNEDYWFGGDGKLDDQNNPTNPFETNETETETQDKIDQDKLDLLDKVVDDMDDELSDGELKEDLLDETPGLKLSVPRITYKDQDDLEGRLEIEINGKVYKYRVNPEVDLTTDELASKVTGIQKYSDGKALAYLKRNAHTVNEGLQLKDEIINKE